MNEELKNIRNLLKTLYDCSNTTAAKDYNRGITDCIKAIGNEIDIEEKPKYCNNCIYSFFTDDSKVGYCKLRNITVSNDFGCLNCKS